MPSTGMVFGLSAFNPAGQDSFALHKGTNEHMRIWQIARNSPKALSACERRHASSQSIGNAGGKEFGKNAQ